MKNKIFALHEGAKKSALSPFTTGSLAILSLGLASNLTAEQDLGSLPDTTVIANRTATSLDKVGSSVSILQIEDLQKQGILHLDEALKYAPGVISPSTSGQRGSSSNIFLRGTTTAYTHFRVDGIRVSDTNIQLGNFLGGNNLVGLSRIEILRGPQSALYGGDAIGGVIGLYSHKGSGEPSGRFSVQAGSFDTINTSLSLQGQLDKLSYSLGLGYETSDNDLPNNSYNTTSYTLRLDYELSDAISLGLTLRGFDSEYNRPIYNDPAFPLQAIDNTQSTLGSIFAEFKANEIWTSKLTLGIYDESYKSQDTNSVNSVADASKVVAYWDNTLSWNDSHTTTTGIVHEHTTYDAFSTSNYDDLYGIYLNHNWEVTNALTLNGGLRWEDYDSYGNETTWRLASAYNISDTNTKLRASVGSGFRPPNFLQRYGGAFGYQPNPDIEAEQSIGWDVGVDQIFCDGQYKVSATYFSNQITDMIEGYPLAANTTGTTDTEGVEFAASAHWLEDKLHATLAYTYLSESIAGQPDHSASLLLNADITEQLNAGISVNYLDTRTFNNNELDAYATVDLNARYKVNDSISLTARVANLFDEDYEHYNFSNLMAPNSTFPGRGRGVFGGITIEW